MTVWELIALAKAGDGGGGGGDTSLFRFKGSVLTTDDLPDSGENGDVYHVDADGGEYAYIVIEGQEPYWESLGPLVVVDSALSGTSENPVQNKVIYGKMTSTAEADAIYHLGFYLDEDGDLCQVEEETNNG